MGTHFIFNHLGEKSLSQLCNAQTVKNIVKLTYTIYMCNINYATQDTISHSLYQLCYTRYNITLIISIKYIGQTPQQLYRIHPIHDFVSRQHLNISIHTRPHAGCKGMTNLEMYGMKIRQSTVFHTSILLASANVLQQIYLQR